MIKLGIYIHIPFCVKKCKYCDFLSAPGTEDQIDQYVTALVQEMKCRKGSMESALNESFKKYQIDSIFIGGGTPSILPEYQMGRIFKGLTDNFQLAEQVEFTVECNPGTVTRSKLKFYFDNQVNRISFGLQTCVENELKALGRMHDYQDFLNGYQWAKEVGFTNINVDIMAAIPEQTVESYKNTCEKVIALDPQHISAYSLIIEEDTLFWDLYHTNPPVSEEVDRQQYQLTKDIFSRHQFQRYEISNYAKPGYECKHNLKYWNREDYLGLGLGAASMLSNVRYKNVSDMSIYLNQGENDQFTYDEVEELSIEEQMEEFIFLGFRKTAGISIKEFRDKYFVSLEEIASDSLTRLEQQGLIFKKNGFLCLTDKGLDLCNYVVGEVISSL